MIGIVVFRSDEIISKIKSVASSPYIIQNAITKDERMWLLEIYNNTKKETPKFGKDEVYRFDGLIREKLIKWIKEKFVLEHDYNIDMISGKTNLGVPPPWFHIDKSHKKIEEGCLDEILYKTIFIPLWTDGDIAACSTVFAKQYYFHHNVYFAIDDEKARLPYGINNYDGVYLLNESIEFDLDFYRMHLSHIPYENLKGLQPDRALYWNKGSAIIFDRTQLHSSNNYIAKGLKNRKFLQIHTTLKE